MESEKVKEIKEALEDNANYKHYDKLGYIDGYKCKTVAYADILTLINELESEKDKYKNLYETMYKKYAKLEAETYTKEDVAELKDRIAELEEDINDGELVSIDWHNEQVMQAENRIAELEKEKVCEHCQRVILGKEVYCLDCLNRFREISLKQFAEKLKEKCNDKNDFICSNSITAKEIDETLKEFIND
jgi:molybdenum cofactor biosynthesis enzyme MoaA